MGGVDDGHDDRVFQPSTRKIGRQTVVNGDR